MFCSGLVILVGEIQQVDKRNDEHPNQIHITHVLAGVIALTVVDKVPVEPDDLKVIRVITATLVA